MNSLEAFAKNSSATASGACMDVFDWDEAARLIKKYNATTAGIGLAEDIEWTYGNILRDREPVEKHSGAYYMSTWATPVLYLDIKIEELYPDDEERVIYDEYGDWALACYTSEEEAPEWADDTVWWPESALAILNEK